MVIIQKTHFIAIVKPWCTCTVRVTVLGFHLLGFCTAAQRRKLQAKLSVIGPPPAPPPATGTVYPTSTSGGELGSVDIQEENSGGEDGEVGTQWNWRDDEK